MDSQKEYLNKEESFHNKEMVKGKKHSKKSSKRKRIVRKGILGRLFR